MAEKDNQTVNLSKETRRDIASAIRDLSRQFRESRDEAKSRTFADNIAHGLASGASVRQSISEASSVSAERSREAFKKAIDPVQIVKRLTGGSKLASVLAGRALGRNPYRVRAGAGIPQPAISSPISDATPTPFTPPSTSPTQLAGDGAQTVLRDMLKYMGMITLQVTSIADKMGAHGVARNKKGQFTEMAAPQYKMLKEIKNLLILDHKEDKKYQKQSLAVELEQQRLLRESEELRRQAAIEAERQNDLARAQAYKSRFGHGPRQINGMGMDVRGAGAGAGGGTEAGGSGGIMRPLLTSLAAVLGVEGLLHGKGLLKAGAKLGGAALNAIKHPLKTTGAVLGAAGRLVTKPIETIKSAVSAVKSFAGVGEKVAEKVVAPGVGAASKIIAGTAGVAGGAKLAGTFAERLGNLEKTAGPLGKAAKAGKGAVAGGKAAIGALVQKLMPSMMKKYGGKLSGSLIPGLGTLIGAGMTAASLMKGDYIGAGINAVGMIPYAGIATIPIAIAREIYSEAYDGADPFTDPLRGQRMPELVAAVQQQVGDWISKKEPAPSQVAGAESTSPEAVSPVTPESPSLSEQLSEQADLESMFPPHHVAVPPKTNGENLLKMSREAAAGPTNVVTGSSQQTSPVVVSNNPITNINNQITQKMTSTRNTESSFLARQYLAGVTS